MTAMEDGSDIDIGNVDVEIQDLNENKNDDEEM